jgi:hypothetical protein
MWLARFNAPVNDERRQRRFGVRSQRKLSGNCQVQSRSRCHTEAVKGDGRACRTCRVEDDV